MASCDDDFSLLGENHHHHHHHVATFARFATKHSPSPAPAPSLHHHHHPHVHPHHHQQISNAGPSKTPEDYGDPKFVSSCFDTDDPSASAAPTDPSDTTTTANATTTTTTNNNNPFAPIADDDDPDRKPSKRRDRCGASPDDLSDDGVPANSPYCTKKPKTTPCANSNATGDYRKDREEWSDSAIGCLLDAYTDKFLQLNRGNLRGRDWVEVAAIVSERADQQKSCCDKQKVTKSVEQCKNKMDNLKKRYKVELQRINNGSMTVSHWTWFKKMEQIVGSSAPPGKSASGSASTAAAAAAACAAGGAVSAPVSDEEKAGSTGSAAYVSRQTKRYATTPGPIGLANNMKTKSLANPRWRRVVFRISGAALAGNGPQNVDPKVTMLIAREVAMANRLGVEVAIVIGGRNFFCADTWVASSSLDRATAYQIGMMATVMNSLLLQASLEKLGVQTRVQTTFAMHEVAEPYVKRRAIRHLEKGRVVIFGGVGAGLGSSLFTTDTAAALRASEISADAVLKGTNMDGVYDCQSRNGNNVTFEHISFREFVSRGFTAMDMTAISFCEENGIPVVIFNLLEPGNISRALCGDQVGTLIDQSGRMS